VTRSLFVTGNVDALRSCGPGPEARIGLTWIDASPGPVATARLGAEYWNPMFRLVHAERVAAVHDLVSSSTWTVTTPHMARVSGGGRRRHREQPDRRPSAFLS